MLFQAGVLSQFSLPGLQEFDSTEAYVIWLTRRVLNSVWPREKEGQRLHIYHQLLIDYCIKEQLI